MANTKKEERLYKQFDKDNNLLFPVPDKKKSDVVRDEFIKKLIASPDFVATYKANDKMMEEPVKKIIRNLEKPLYVAIALMGLTFGGITAGIVAQDDQQNISIKNISGQDVAVITLALLLGVFVGGVTAVGFRQIHYESAIDSMFYHVSVRLFRELKKYHPELNESVLKSCNPEMARVIKALLIANMSEQDIMKIRSIAFKSANLHVKPRYNAYEALKDFDKDIKEALKIVEKTLLFNEPLKNEVLNVLKGNVPATFVLNQAKQNTK